ncbi:MAG: hypothetical protein CL561_09980 [Alphaproteobacteria bacterium]|nr:hypothetical protein [Alphaproteobacteria bacterium]
MSNAVKSQNKFIELCKRMAGACASKKAARIGAEILAIILVFLLLFVGLVLWKLRSAPIDISFVKPAILKTVNSEGSPYQVDFSHIVIAWPELEGSLKLRALDMQLKSGAQEVFSISKADLFLDMRAMIRGKLAIDEVVLYSPRAHILREANNSFSIDIASDKEAVKTAPDAQQEPDTNFASDIIETLLKPEEDALKADDKLGYLDRFEIREAEIIISDKVSNMTWFLPQIDLALTRWDKGINAQAAINLSPYSSEDHNKVNLDVTYERDNEQLEAKINLEKFDVAILSRYIKELKPFRKHEAKINGRFIATFNKDLTLDNAVIDVNIPEIGINLPQEFQHKKTINNIILSGFFDNKERNYQLDLRSLEVDDTKLNGKISGTFQGMDYQATAKLEAPQIDLNFFKNNWPSSLKSESASVWLTEKLSKGQFHNIKGQVALAHNFDSGATTVTDPRLDFSFDNVHINYRAPMLPVDNAEGHGFIDETGLEIFVDNGMVADLKLSEGDVKLKNIYETGKGIADIKLKLAGPVPTVFAYISKEPIALGDRFDFKPEETKGDATLDIALTFPTIKDLLATQVKVDLDATLNEVYIPNAVKNYALTDGPFTVKYDSEKIILSGNGKLLDRPVKLDWTRYVDSDAHKDYSIINASFKGDKKLRDAFNIDLDDYISGPPAVKLTYKERPNNAAVIDVDLDLTPAKFFINPFDYIKAEKQAGNASAHIIIRDGEVHEINRLNINTPDTVIKNAKIQFGKVGKEWDIKSGEFNKVQIQKNKFDLEISRPSSQVMRFEVDGTYLDLLPFLSVGDSVSGSDEDSNNKTAPKPSDKSGTDIEVFAKTKRLNTSKVDGRLDDATAYVMINGNDVINQLEMDAKAEGKPVYLRYKPAQDSGKLEFRLEADDAGAFLRAFNLYENVKGGKIVVFGEPTAQGHPNNIKGKAMIDDFMVTNAPTLARLLNAMTLTGVEELLTQEGITFDRLESNLNWKISNSGIKFEFRKGRTSGGALGLTFEGNIHQGQRNEIDINGTIVPISFINKFISKIPLLGSILTGGENQGIFAATYTIKGTSEKTKVSINPLSVLAPGIIRRILFEESPDDSDE